MGVSFVWRDSCCVQQFAIESVSFDDDDRREGGRDKLGGDPPHPERSTLQLSPEFHTPLAQDDTSEGK